jgi:hypothetical protein
MNKVLLSIVVVAVIAVALGTAGLVYAQSSTPQAPASGTGYGTGMGLGRGMRGGMAQGTGRGYNAANAGQGFLHEDMVSYFAEKLGLTTDAINTRLSNGETMSQIAFSTGLTVDQFSALMLEARSQAIDQAVTDGTLTQAQANWMKQRGAGMAAGSGAGLGRGAGTGLHANPACPYAQSN